MPRCDTKTMNLHLAEIAAEVAPGAHAVLLVDQAGWHMSNRLVVPRNNLVERFFNKIKHYRAVATRYNKTSRKLPRQSKARFISLRIWMRFNESITWIFVLSHCLDANRYPLRLKML
jgi:hypothetical protein